jgi:hypothetical protein
MNYQNKAVQTSRSSFWQILGIVFLIVVFLSLVILVSNPASAQAEKLRKLQEPVQSEMVADYSIDTQRGTVPQISLLLVKDFLSDRMSADEVNIQFNAFMQSLQTLVPTVTPNLVVIVPVTGPIEPTGSLFQTWTPTPSATILPTDTEVPEPIPTVTRTPWIVTLTWTPWPTSGPGNPPTFTSAPPQPTVTLTPVPTFTATMTLTEEPVPTETLAPTTAPSPTTQIPPGQLSRTPDQPTQTSEPTPNISTPAIPADPVNP